MKINSIKIIHQKHVLSYSILQIKSTEKFYYKEKYRRNTYKNVQNIKNIS